MNSRIATGANDEAISAWNGVLFDKFVRFREIATGGLAQHGSYALARHAPPAGGRVLDIGSGFGDSTFEIARAIGDQGVVVGVDAASRFRDSAAREASELGLRNTRFLAADAESAELDGPYDFAFSRFGTMFFSSPVRAFENVRRALHLGRELCMVVWRTREDNEFVHVAERIVKALVAVPLEHGEPTCGPGPFALAGADLVSDVLKRAGFEGVTLERHDSKICIGRSLDEAIDLSLELGPAGEIMRLAGAEGARRESVVVRALREGFAPYVRSDGSVFMGSSAWVVTARNGIAH